MDAQGCNIRVDARGREVMRVLPRLNEDVNEEWISDKTRHACDGLRASGSTGPISGGTASSSPRAGRKPLPPSPRKLKGHDGARLAAIVGDLAAAEEIKALKLLADALGSPNLDCRQDGAKLDPALGRASLSVQLHHRGRREADAILLVGTNPRWDAPVLNARIRKAWRQAGGMPIGQIGPAVDLTYPDDHLGAGPETLDKIANGSPSPSPRC